MQPNQILAITIFVLMFAAIIYGKIHRYIPALIGAALVIGVVFLGVMRSPQAVTSVLNFGALIQRGFWWPGHTPFESHGVNWQTVIFITGMMVMVEGMAEVGFFRWLCLYVARIARCRVVPIMVIFMLLSGFLAMFIDSITVLLFMATVTIELARLLEFDPAPVIIAEIFAANVGGSATMSGDPPNIIIGTALGYNFTDFIVNTGLIAWAGMLLSLIFFYLVFRKSLTASQKCDFNEVMKRYPDPKAAITDPSGFRLVSGIFILTVILLVSHAQTGLAVGTIGVIAGVLTLLARRKNAFHIIRRVDWRTLIFFIGLFICVGGLEETGVLKLAADYIGSVANGNFFLVLSIILWFSAFASAIIDNIPFAATMVPIIQQLALSSGFDLHALAWSLALGTDIGGNGTPIGASANVVGTAIAEREGYRIGWGKFLKYALPAMILVVALCWLLLGVRYG